MQKTEQMSFWDHLDELRGVIIRCLVAWAVCAVVCFLFKDHLFAVFFAPSKSDFILYRLLERLATATGIETLSIGEVHTNFINTELTGQFATHLSISLWSGLVLAMPYMAVCFYGFISPALYKKEKSLLIGSILSGTALFAVGVTVNYFVIFPFSFRFLSGYQVDASVENIISLGSYISSLLVMSLILGILFELPVVGWLLGKAGVINANLLIRYRKYAIVGILIVAAVITPTGDAFTLMLVTVPIYILYEFTILIVRYSAQ